MRFTGIRGYLFDLDGVLADSTEAINRHWTVFARQNGLDVDDLLARAHGRRADDLMRELLPAHALEEAYESFVELEAADCSDTTAIRGGAVLLASLPADRWAVVTSGDRRVATGRLAAAGLPLPSVLITANDVIEGKPSPEGYLRAAETLGVDPAHCLALEDSPAGLRAARAAGALVVGCTTTHAAPEVDAVAHHRVRDLGDVVLDPADGTLLLDCGSCGQAQVFM